MGYLEDENKNIMPEDFSSVYEHINKFDATLKTSEPDADLNREPSAFNRPLKWSNIIILSVLHVTVILTYLYNFDHPMKLQSLLFTFLIGALSGIATSAGSHRLWSHRAYKASEPLKVFLLVFQAITMNGSALSYARDHRTHHRFSDTDGDPKNPTRGLFYSHIGWWLVKKTPTVIKSGRKLDFSDLYNDYWLYFQHRYYIPIFILFGLVLPFIIPIYFWNEDPIITLTLVSGRIFVILHHLFTVNSLAHFFGNRPYDFRIRPADHRIVNYISFGEGIHNFHHVFPFDYRINNRPQWELFTPPIAFVHLCYYLGLATDLKTASPAVIKEVINKRGVKAMFDEERSLKWRIGNAILDWTMGLIVSIWIVMPGLFYKLWAGKTTLS